MSSRNHPSSYFGYFPVLVFRGIKSRQIQSHRSHSSEASHDIGRLKSKLQKPGRYSRRLHYASLPLRKALLPSTKQFVGDILADLIFLSNCQHIRRRDIVWEFRLEVGYHPAVFISLAWQIAFRRASITSCVVLSLNRIFVTSMLKIKHSVIVRMPCALTKRAFSGLKLFHIGH